MDEPTPSGSTARALVALLRPAHWIKNAFVAVPLLFAQESLAGLAAGLIPVAIAVAAFSLMASGVYAINDVLDREEDRRHPTKRDRPVASGRISAGAAGGLAAVLVAAAIALTGLLPVLVTVALVAYLINNLLYSTWFKRLPLLDVFSIAAGFLLRIWAGAAAIAVPISADLFLTVFFLTLFLGLGKRRHELLLGDDSGTGEGPSRAVLQHYSVYYLDQLMVISATTTLLIYVRYCIDAGAATILATIPLVTLGLFRYFHLTHNRDRGEPTDELTRDPVMLLTALAYGAVVVVGKVLGP